MSKLPSKASKTEQSWTS